MNFGFPAFIYNMLYKKDDENKHIELFIETANESICSFYLGSIFWKEVENEDIEIIKIKKNEENKNENCVNCMNYFRSLIGNNLYIDNFTIKFRNILKEYQKINNWYYCNPKFPDNYANSNVAAFCSEEEIKIPFCEIPSVLFNFENIDQSIQKCFFTIFVVEIENKNLIQQRNISTRTFEIDLLKIPTKIFNKNIIKNFDTFIKNNFNIFDKIFFNFIEEVIEKSEKWINKHPKHKKHVPKVYSIQPDISEKQISDISKEKIENKNINIEDLNKNIANDKNTDLNENLTIKNDKEIGFNDKPKNRIFLIIAVVLISIGILCFIVVGLIKK